MNYEHIEKIDIYVGLKDNDKLIEKYTIEDIIKFLSKICTNKKIGFSLTKLFGGYVYNNNFLTENSLRITLLGIKENDLNELVDSLKERVNAKEVIITKEECDYKFM